MSGFRNICAAASVKGRRYRSLIVWWPPSSASMPRKPRTLFGSRARQPTNQPAPDLRRGATDTLCRLQWFRPMIARLTVDFTGWRSGVKSGKQLCQVCRKNSRISARAHTHTNTHTHIQSHWRSFAFTSFWKYLVERWAQVDSEQPKARNDNQWSTSSSGLFAESAHPIDRLVRVGRPRLATV